MKTFNWEDINFKNRNSGVLKTTCPVCSHERKKKKDPCLAVWFEIGVAKCYNCDSKAFKDGFKPQTTKEYTLPSQEWRNYTKLSEKLVLWFEEKRGIKQFTLNHFEIGEETIYQPAKNKNMNSVVFNFLERDILVNKKYRSGQKDWTQSAGGKPILYNINSIIGCDEVYITEGEIDAMSLHQIGKTNVVSIPNGANDNDAYWQNSEPYIKDVKKFFICTDNDEKGDEVAEKIAQRLGRYRCERVIFKNKDANEDLVAGVLEESILNTKEYPVSGTIKHNDLLSEMLNLRENGVPETIKPKQDRFNELNSIFSIMMGQLTVVTGIPSHGKSNFIEDYIYALVNDLDLKASLFSPEHSPSHLHAMHLCSKAIGKYSFQQNDTEIINYVNWANERVYFTNIEGQQEPTWDWYFETMQAQMLRFGVNIFLIDAFNKLTLKGNNELAEIRTILTKLTSFAQQNNVHIFLVAHPKKMNKNKANTAYEIPDLYDVSGSADFRNQTHNGLCVYRDFTNNTTLVVNLKTKFQFQGSIGSSATFQYDTTCGRYFQNETQPYRVSYTDNTEVMRVSSNEVYNHRVLDPTKAFQDQVHLVPYDNEEVPF